MVSVVGIVPASIIAATVQVATGHARGETTLRYAKRSMHVGK
jgi:hypothetical protein